MFCKDLEHHKHIDYCRNIDAEHLCKKEGKFHITHPVNPEPKKPKDYITHASYWAAAGFEDPYTQRDQEKFKLCDAECSGEEHRASGGARSFCCLPMFHAPMDRIEVSKGYVSADGHHFTCNDIEMPVASYHIIFVIDRSGSMGGYDMIPQGTPVTNQISNGHKNRLGAAYEAVYRFLVARKSQLQGKSADDRISVILFKSTASVAIENKAIDEIDLIQNLLRFSF
ncbi:hypothetical protein HK096_001644, partial [Nowakowskiella sp. JEL0078]